MTIPLGWIKLFLLAIAFFGAGLGAFSLILPAHSIRFYQWMMRSLNWNVEPIDYGRELRNTRILGAGSLVLSLLLLTTLIRSEWFGRAW